MLRRLIDRRQRNLQVLRILHIVEANKSNVPGNRETRVERGPHGADSHHVVVAEDAIRLGLALKQRAHHFVARVIVGPSKIGDGENEVFAEFDVTVAQSEAKPTETLRGGAQVGTADVGETPAAQMNEVLGSQLAAGKVVCADEIRAQVGKRPVKQNERRMLIVHAHEALELFLAGGNQQRIDAPGKHHADLGLLHLGVVIGRS